MAVECVRIRKQTLNLLWPLFEVCEVTSQVLPEGGCRNHRLDQAKQLEQESLVFEVLKP